MTAPCPRFDSDDTIVAQSTAPGAAAIAIVRLAGPRAQAVAHSLLQGPLPQAHRLARQRLYGPHGDLLDEAMVVHMPAPHSYTGDDVVELHVHGGPAVSHAVQAACHALGARPAEAGEFTRRAYANGKLSLTSIEAVAALVHAESEQERQASVSLLAGGLEGHLRPVMEELMQVVALARASMDFPEDVAQEAFPAASVHSVQRAVQMLATWLTHHQPVGAPEPQWVLRGPSNAGKSTLLNALVGFERSLTDAAPGTTRDAVSAAFSDFGGRVTLWDTAGHNEEATGIEARGIAMASSVSEQATVILWLLGPKLCWPPSALQAHSAELWVVGSHADVFDAETRQAVEQQACARGLNFAGFVSAPTGEGMDAFRARLRSWRQADAGEARIALSQRHIVQLHKAHASLNAGLAAKTRAEPDDLVLLEMEEALAALDAIFGAGVGPQVFEQIFARFCIGK